MKDQLSFLLRMRPGSSAIQKSPVLTLTLACLGTAFTSSGQVIDFESLPNGSLVTNRMVISNQFLQPFGVSFRFENGTYPQIAQVGAPPTAFWGPPNNTSADRVVDGQNVGTNFLTDDGVIGEAPPPLIITYSSAVAQTSGFILDIDRQEAWDVEARNSLTQIVARVHLGARAPFTGDGVATPWSFNRPSADIHSVRILYTGDTNDNPGLAFDNFSPAAARPMAEPARLALQIFTNLPRLSVEGMVGAVYEIQTTTSLPSTNWTALTSIVLPSSPFSLTNVVTTNSAQRYYRALGN
jgi:hypothetical protein